jgi:hypothetical protein
MKFHIIIYSEFEKMCGNLGETEAKLEETVSFIRSSCKL